MNVTKYYLVYGHDQASLHYKKLAFVKHDPKIQGPSDTHRTVVGPFDTVMEAGEYLEKNRAHFIKRIELTFDLEEPVPCGAV